VASRTRESGVTRAMATRKAWLRRRRELGLEDVPGVEACVHAWEIESGGGEFAAGVCRRCGAVGHFFNSEPESAGNWNNR